MIDRRDWLLMVGGGLLAACTAPPEESTPKTQQPESKEVSPRPVQVKVVKVTVTTEGQRLGRLYRLRTPGEATEAALRAALPAGPEAVNTQISAEYAADDVVVLRGWILARSEARLLALGAVLGGTATL